MKKAQFLYFITVVGNEKLLKSEIELYYPWLKFSYSRPGICTFKNTSRYLSLEEISQLSFCFALTWGETIAIKKLTEINHESLTSLQLDYPQSELHFYQLDHLGIIDSWTLPITSIPAERKLDIIRTHRDEVLLGFRHKDRWNSPWMRKFSAKREDVISRAYYKGADAFPMFLPNQKEANVLELGSAPGGISQFLLEQGHYVLGVDPAQMDNRLIEHPQFKHVKTSIQDFQVSQDKFEIIVSDMNLSPKLVLREVARINKSLPKLHSLFITLKLTDGVMVKDLPTYKGMAKEMGFSSLEMVQLPYHKKECLLFAHKKC